MQVTADEHNDGQNALLQWGGPETADHAVRTVAGPETKPGGLAGLQPQWMLEEPRLEHEPREEQEHQLEEENSADQQGGVDSSTTRRQ